MRYRSLVLATVALAAIAVLFAVGPWRDRSTPSVAVDRAGSEPPRETEPPPDGALLVMVTRFADGDSFEIEWIDPRPATVGRDEVRLFGINAPEGPACFGHEARDELARLVAGSPVLIEMVGGERDGFGRVIANVWNADGVSLNVEMVRVGAALAFSDGGSHADAIAAAQREAQAAGVGLWSQCSADADLAIVDIRFDAAGPDDENANDEWIEIANLGAVAVDLTGWGIRDESTRHRYRFPDGFRLGDASVRVRSGCGTDTDQDLFWCAGDPVWNNAGDTGFLVDADGRFVDEWSYSG